MICRQIDFLQWIQSFSLRFSGQMMCAHWVQHGVSMYVRIMFAYMHRRLTLFPENLLNLFSGVSVPWFVLWYPKCHKSQRKKWAEKWDSHRETQVRLCFLWYWEVNSFSILCLSTLAEICGSALYTQPSAFPWKILTYIHLHAELYMYFNTASGIPHQLSEEIMSQVV